MLAYFKEQGESCTPVSDPKSLKSAVWDLIFFLNLDSKGLALMQPWQVAIRAHKVSGRFLVLYHDQLSEEWRQLLDPEIEIGEEHALDESLVYLFEEAVDLHEAEEGQIKSNVGSPMTFDLDKVEGDALVLTEAQFDSNVELPSPADSGIESSGGDFSSFADNSEDGDSEFAMDPGAETRVDIAQSNMSSALDNLDNAFSMSTDGADAQIEALADESHASAESMGLGDIDFASNDEVATLDSGDLSFDIQSDEPQEPVDLAADLGADLGDIFESEVSMIAESDEGPVFDSGSSDPASDLGDDLFSINDDGPVSHPDTNIKAPLAGRDTFNAEISSDEIFSKEGDRATRVSVPSIDQDEPSDFFEAPSADSNQRHAFDDYRPSSEAKSGDLQTLQKYASIKEREAREKESTIQVLKGQLSKIDTKLSRSESERRRLTLENDEIKTQLSTVEEELSQKKFYLQKVESQHQEETRGINLRLDNAIFQANKAQNRLEDFRERVRNDFVKIRAQERELFNKLELQKRDAEALLGSKDEQLLNQRREIDRLQYEVETLRERMMEDTERAEERASRLSRAVQSLKLANDMLSGLTEEVLPSAGDRFSDSKSSAEEDEAA